MPILRVNSEHPAFPLRSASPGEICAKTEVGLFDYDRAIPLARQTCDVKRQSVHIILSLLCHGCDCKLNHWIYKGLWGCYHSEILEKTKDELLIEGQIPRRQTSEQHVICRSVNTSNLHITLL